MNVKAAIKQLRECPSEAVIEGLHDFAVVGDKVVIRKPTAGKQGEARKETPKKVAKQTSTPAPSDAE